MTSTLLVALSLALQVPPPTSGDDVGKALAEESRSLMAKEAAALGALADRLAKDGEAKGSDEVRKLLPKPADGPGTRLTPLPDVVEPHPKPIAAEAAWRGGVETIRKPVGEAFFDLAKRAADATPPHMGRAATALREAIVRIPDDAEARRLLGYVPHEGGWAKPFAVDQLKAGNVSHPTYGWIPEDWVPHLELGPRRPRPAGDLAPRRRG